MSPVASFRYSQLLGALRAAGKAGLTRKAAAAALGLKVSPYIRQLLDALVSDGLASASFESIWTGSRFTYAWVYRAL